MANVVTLAQARLHLRVTQTDEDSLIQLYIEASEQQIRNWLNRRIPGEDLATPNIPSAVKAAALLIITGLYENRSDVLTGTVEKNIAVMNLLFPYRVEMGI
jgi:hypothetical protein